MFELDRLRARDIPPATAAIAAVTIVAFILETLAGGSESTAVLVRLGASQHELVWTHRQFFRLVCPIFLHIGIAHILMNGYAYVQLAPFVEKIWGSARFLIVYIVSGIGGTLLSSAAGGNVSAGASGALLGIVGFLISVAYTGRQKHEVRTIVRTAAGQSLLIWVGATFVFGFTVGHIDNLAHLGGLLTGAALGLIVTGVDKAGPLPLGAAGALVLATLASFGLCYRQGEVDLDLMSPFLQAFQRGIDEFHEGEKAETEQRDADAKTHFERAAQEFDRAVFFDTKDPNVPNALLNEARAYLRAGEVDDAERAAKACLAQAQNPEATNLLAEVAERRGVDDFNAALAAQDAKKPHADAVKGFVSAARHFEEAAAMGPEPQLAAEVLGKAAAAYLNAEMPDDAFRAARASYDQAPSRQAVDMLVGIALAKNDPDAVLKWAQGNPDRADEIVQAAERAKKVSTPELKKTYDALEAKARALTGK